MDFETLWQQKFLRLILSNKKDKSCAYNKVVVTPFKLRGKEAWQMTRYTDRQAFHENLTDFSMLKKSVEALFVQQYKQLNFFGVEEDIEFRQTKKGKIVVSSYKHAEKRVIPQTHNRTKHYLLSEGEVVPALVDIGVMTREGRLVTTQMDKFYQINKFLEIVEETLKNWQKKEICVVDFGCGKSYLTFVLYHYLTKIRGLNAKVIGLDLKAEVIEKCNVIAEKYGYKNLSFKIGNIETYEQKEPVDMVVSLHACDTATDFALFQAIQWQVPMILSVPCCQHELNQQMKNIYPVLTKYGLLKERFCALLTDGIRASLLESVGYSVQVLEFVDMTHTPKNVLIRAIKNNRESPNITKDIGDLCAQMKINPTLYKLLTKAK